MLFGPECSLTSGHAYFARPTPVQLSGPASRYPDSTREITKAFSALDPALLSKRIYNLLSGELPSFRPDLEQLNNA